MKYKKYLQGGVEVSVLGFGAWPLGNTSQGRTMTELEGIDLVRQAYNKGINFFDTAPNYGHGLSEVILGKALVGIRDRVVINSKFGHHHDGTLDFDESHLASSIKGSCERLQTDYLDSVILHNPPLHILKSETRHFEHLEKLKEEGVIKGYGVSIDTLEELKLTLAHLRVDVIELLYNVFNQSARGCLEEIKTQDIALIIKVPLDSGWLTGAYTADTVFSDIRIRWTQADKDRRHALVKRLQDLVGSKEIAPYALGFLWSYNAVTTVIPGMRTVDQLCEHVESEAYVFPAALKSGFEAFFDEFIAHEMLPW